MLRRMFERSRTPRTYPTGRNRRATSHIRWTKPHNIWLPSSKYAVQLGFFPFLFGHFHFRCWKCVVAGVAWLYSSGIKIHLFNHKEQSKQPLFSSCSFSLTFFSTFSSFAFTSIMHRAKAFIVECCRTTSSVSLWRPQIGRFFCSSSFSSIFHVSSSVQMESLL